MDTTIPHNLKIIQNRIHDACLAHNRDPNTVKLLLATKTVPATKVLETLKLGETLIGENKVQEIKEKYEVLKTCPHTNHFIGHLQTNKVNEILKYNVSCIQSLDRLSLAEKLQQRLTYEDRYIDVFIQVNTSHEESKFGLHPDAVIDFVQQVSAMDRLRIKGLMTIGLFSAEADKIRPCFKLLKSLQAELRSLDIKGTSFDELSMGMSGDLEIAISEGATIVRVGTAIFGERQYPDSHYWPETKK